MSHRLSAALVAALMLAGCAPAPGPSATPTPSPTPPATATPTPSASATATPSATPTGSTTAGLVYYIVDTTRGFRLAREPHPLSADAPARAALEAMISGPTDVDYTSPWPRATRVLGINHRDHLITVELSNEARQANVGASLEASMVQQLIWTVTEALEPGAAVLVTLEGVPASWGHLLWDKPLKRGEPLDERLLVGIDSLADGANVTSPVRVTGEANVFEATLTWKVLRMDGATAASGYTSTSEGQTFAPWALTLTLEPGTYILEVSEGDPSGGLNPRPPDRDSRQFEVR